VLLYGLEGRSQTAARLFQFRYHILVETSHRNIQSRAPADSDAKPLLQKTLFLSILGAKILPNYDPTSKPTPAQFTFKELENQTDTGNAYFRSPMRTQRICEEERPAKT